MRLLRLSPMVLGVLLLALSSGLPAQAQSPGPAAGHGHDEAVCPGPAAPGDARCHAHRRTDITTLPIPHAVAQAAVLGNNGAYDPAFLQAAYNLTASASSSGSGQTVALIDAYNDPTAESDLGYYRAFFGLPPCTTANGCFTKVNQSGQQGAYPSSNAGWAQEIALDLDMVSALCPQCHLLLVEATSASIPDLGTAVNTAARLGATAISNSYGGSESSCQVRSCTSRHTTSPAYDTYYNHPGIAITASSGDGGYGVDYPAASPYVTAVGGTSLYQATNTGTRNATETAWSGAGSGCSAYEPKPSWQADRGCGTRTVADVAAVADPNTGVWVYDTYRAGGWAVFGGTSVASPLTAAVYALAGNAGVIGSGSFPYGHSSALNDITAGSTGSCGGSYLCTAGPGYDGPTGLGTPNGTGAY
jgi:subtilase family serine protease